MSITFVCGQLLVHSYSSEESVHGGGDLARVSWMKGCLYCMWLSLTAPCGTEALGPCEKQISEDVRRLTKKQEKNPNNSINYWNRIHNIHSHNSVTLFRAIRIVAI